MLMNVTVDHVCFTINTLDGHGLLITTRLLATAPRFREIKSKKREMDMYARELYYSWESGCRPSFIVEWGKDPGLWVDRERYCFTVKGKKWKKVDASAGSRTRVYCLEGNYPNRWTTDALVGDVRTLKTNIRVPSTTHHYSDCVWHDSTMILYVKLQPPPCGCHYGSANQSQRMTPASFILRLISTTPVVLASLCEGVERTTVYLDANK